MTAKKKPKIYTKTGRVKKPAAVGDVTAQYAKAMAETNQEKSYKESIALLQKELAITTERATRLELHAKYWEDLHDSWKACLASRTVKLWFGWSLVRQEKK